MNLGRRTPETLGLKRLQMYCLEVQKRNDHDNRGYILKLSPGDGHKYEGKSADPLVGACQCLSQTESQTESEVGGLGRRPPPTVGVWGCPPSAIRVPIQMTWPTFGCSFS